MNSFSATGNKSGSGDCLGVAGAGEKYLAGVAWKRHRTAAWLHKFLWPGDFDRKKNFASVWRFCEGSLMFLSSTAPIQPASTRWIIDITAETLKVVGWISKPLNRKCNYSDYRPLGNRFARKLLHQHSLQSLAFVEISNSSSFVCLNCFCGDVLSQRWWPFQGWNGLTDWFRSCLRGRQKTSPRRCWLITWWRYFKTRLEGGQVWA